MGSFTTGCFFQNISPTTHPEVKKLHEDVKTIKHTVNSVAQVACSNNYTISMLQSSASNWDFASNAAVYTYISLEGYAFKQRHASNLIPPSYTPRQLNTSNVRLLLNPSRQTSNLLKTASSGRMIDLKKTDFRYTF